MPFLFGASCFLCGSGGILTMGYLYEMHAHTCDVSPCGRVTPERLVALYLAAGYSGVVITNHLSRHVYREREDWPWEQKVDYFLNGYRRAKEAGGLTILLGMEITFWESDNDYLVYGLTEDFLYEHGDLRELGIARFHALAQKNQLLVFQAHPFRNNMKVVDPQFLDGIETNNGNSHHDSRNTIAQLWARQHQLLEVSGSDFHYEEDVARGGILLPQPVANNQELLAALRSKPVLLAATDSR